MSLENQIPLDPQTAYQHVQTQLEASDSTPSEFDPRLTASVCLQSSTPEYQAAGAALVAKLADRNGVDISPVLFDLSAALTAPEPKTKVHSIATLERIARLLPTAANNVVDDIVPAISDPNPLVREAACAALTTVLNDYAWDDDYNEISDQKRDQFRQAIEPLFMQITLERDEGSVDWAAPFDVDHPQSTFWGQVEPGDSRRSYIRWHASYAIGLLAYLFPDRIAERREDLVDIPFEADRLETRGYAIDALGRAGATDALQTIRDRAVQMLDVEATEEEGLAILHSMIMESPHLLVDIALDLSTGLESLADHKKKLSAEILLNAAVVDPSEINGPVRDIVQEWLSGAENEDTAGFTFSVELLAAIAANHPDLVLQYATRAVGLSLTASPESDRSETTNCEATQFDAERAWDTLIEIGKEIPEIVWGAIDTNKLRSMVVTESGQSRHAKRLYAHIVPLSPPRDVLENLFEQLCADTHSVSSALWTLMKRDPVALARTACAIFSGRDTPPRRVLKVLKRLSSEVPTELEPLQATLWEWNNMIRPSDKRWSALITTIGRIAVATEDRETVARLLHLEDPEYCWRFLQTSGASAVIQTAPNKAIPPLLDHLSNEREDLRYQIVETFTETTSGLNGWSDTVRDELCERLDDSDLRVRVYAVRALSKRFDATVRSAFDALITTEINPRVRFEVQRVLRANQDSN